MASKAFQKIAEGLQEAIAIAKGEAEPARLYIPVDVKAIRKKLDLSQGEFAAQFGFTINQIRDWEQGRSGPSGGVHAYLRLIERNPGEIRRLREDARE